MPLTIATPSTIANAVSAVRSFRPSRPFSANLVTLRRHPHSYWRASSGFEPGRAAGRRDRRHQTRDHGHDREDDQLVDRQLEAEVVLAERARHERRQEDPEREPERRADQRGDDALVADHASRLPLRHPDRAQHSQLPRSLEDRQRERVHHPEEADDHGEGEQDVEEQQELLDLLILLVDPLGARLEARVREAVECALDIRPRRRAAGSRIEEREAVARALVELVERLLRDARRPEQRVERTALVDPADDELLRLVFGGAHGEGVADGEIPILGDVVRQQRAVVAELREHLVRAVLPAEVVHRGDLVVQAREVGAVAVDLRDVLPDVADRLDAAHVGDGVAHGGRELGVAVLRRDDQVGLDLALDRIAVRHAQAVGEDGDEGHERDPDHQRRRGRRRAARVPARVLAADAVDPCRRQHARELHRPLRLPLRHRAPHPHDEHDQREQRVDESEQDCSDPAERSAGTERAVPEQPVRQRPERPHQDHHDDRQPVTDRADTDRERADEPRREHRDPDEQRENTDTEEGEAVAGARCRRRASRRRARAQRARRRGSRYTA